MRTAVLSSVSIHVLFTHRIRQTFIVTKSFDRLSVFHPHGAAYRLPQLLQLGFGEARFIVPPARSELADVFRRGIYPLLRKLADVNPNIFIFSGSVIKQILGNHIFLEALLENLSFEDEPPHGSPSGICCLISSRPVIRLVPALVAVSRVEC